MVTTSSRSPAVNSMRQILIPLRIGWSIRLPIFRPWESCALTVRSLALAAALLRPISMPGAWTIARQTVFQTVTPILLTSRFAIPLRRHSTSQARTEPSETRMAPSRPTLSRSISPEMSRVGPALGRLIRRWLALWSLAQKPLMA